MAGEILTTISKDDREKAKLLSRKKFETDYYSNILTAQEHGRIKGKAEGKAEGRAEGEREKAIAKAKNLLGLVDSIEKIAKITGQTREEVEGLHVAD